jgi:nicotinamidase-related amidase
MNTDQFINQSRPFIDWMLDWKARLQPLSIASVIQNQPDKVGIISVDVIKGFCTVGPLSSPRVNQTVEPITKLFDSAWAQGVRDIALPQDTHPEDAVEFAQYGPHCIRGTEQSQTVEAFKALPFFEQITVVEKNSINCGVNKPFLAWLHARPHIRTWIAVGDCTDICTYQLAMYLRIWANENQQRGFRVIVPVNCVDTYDLPVNKAIEIGATPCFPLSHDAQRHRDCY